MNFLEKDLEQIIYEADKAELHRRGLLINGKLFRQLRIGNYGIADLVSFKRVSYSSISDGSYPELWVNVIELKKEKINVSSFLQALSYAKGIERYLEGRKFKFDVNIRITLIGKSFDSSSSFCYLPNFLNKYCIGFNQPLEIHTYKYDINGLAFECYDGDLQLTEEGF